jgi:uncharacterized membrane-anchored protein
MPQSDTLHTTANKVAKVTLAFWIMKICATTLGETAGDLLSMTMDVGYAVSSIILLGLFLATLVAQLSAKKFHPFLYWSVILTTSTAGTTMSDYMDRTLGLGYTRGMLILLAALLIVLGAWRLTVGSLSVSTIRTRRVEMFYWMAILVSNTLGTRRVEMFYWMAILVSNTLGTASGDFLADDSGLGFLGGALLVGGLIGLVALAYTFTKINRVALFWVAFVLTRPFGATFGDLLTKTPEKHGLGFGTIGSSAVLAVILVAVILYTTRRAGRADRPGAAPAQPAIPKPVV